MSICSPTPVDQTEAIAQYTDRASAEMKCKMQRMRLCTKQELDSNLCAGSKSDCKYGQTLVWTSDQCNIEAVAASKAAPQPILEVKNLQEQQMAGAQGGIFHVLEYRQKFCTGTYVALEFNSLGQMTQLNIPKSKSPIGQPAVLCNKLDKNVTDGIYTLHSCPGLPEGHCPANCNSCGEDFVKHFELSVCNKGWKLLKGPAPEDCTEEKKECTSKNQVDVGLARWCHSWPY